MDPSQIYVGISIVVLVIMAILVFVVYKNREARKLTPLAGLAFAFVVAGLFFTDEEFIAYGLLGVGIILAIIDIVKKWENK